MKEVRYNAIVCIILHFSVEIDPTHVYDNPFKIANEKLNSADLIIQSKYPDSRDNTIGKALKSKPKRK